MIVYNDPRRFGFFKIFNNQKTLKDYFSRSGPEATSNKFNYKYLIRKLINKWNIDYIYIDSAAQQTRFDFAQNYDITTINAKKSVLDLSLIHI